MKSEFVGIRMKPEETASLRKIAADMSDRAGNTITMASVIRYAIKKLEESYWKN